jgi:hypothetical protein
MQKKPKKLPAKQEAIEQNFAKNHQTGVELNGLRFYITD